MISLELSERQKQMQEMSRYIAEYEIRPIALEAELKKNVPDEFLQRMNEMGVHLNTASFNKTRGETNQSKKENEANRLGVIAMEELAWGDAAIALSLPGPGLGGPPIMTSGTPEQQERFLSIFTPDEPKWGAYAVTEPEAGSDVSGIRTIAKKVDDGYVLNGQKIFITNGKRASWVVVFATVDPSLGRAGHRAFVVEKGMEGFTVPKIVDKMGLRANETAELVFTDCFVPDENLLGGEELYEIRTSSSSGFQMAMKTFDSTRPIVAAMAVGIARAAYEYTLDFVRKEFPKHGRTYAVAVDLLAEAEQDITASRLLTWEAAWRADLGLENAKEAAMCKALAGQVAVKVCSNCLEILGPVGLTGNLVEKWFRDVKVFDIFEGTNEIQHLVIARRQYADYNLKI